MGRDEALGRLRSMESGLRALGAGALFLFGSVRRDEAGPRSDIDLFVDPDPAFAFGFDDFMNVHDLLQIRLGAGASFTTREGLHPLLRDEIAREAVKIF